MKIASLIFYFIGASLFVFSAIGFAGLVLSNEHDKTALVVGAFSSLFLSGCFFAVASCFWDSAE